MSGWWPWGDVSRYTGSALLLIGSLIAAGCGGGGSGGSSSSTDTASLSLSTSVVAFGDLVIGDSAEATVTLTNTGTVSVPIGNTNPGEDFTVTRPCTTLAPGASCVITIRLTPSEQQSYATSFTVGSQETNVTINLSGEGQGLRVQISSLTGTCDDPALTTVRVLVSEPNNTPITYLDANNFVMSIGGAPINPFDFTGIQSLQSVSIALMTDWSRSLTAFRPALQDQLAAFVELFRDDDTAGIYKFATAIDGNAQEFVLTDVAGKALLTEAIYRDFAGTDTPTLLWDAINEVVAKTAQEIRPVRTIVVVTDGFDDGSRMTLEELIDNALEANVAIFTIGFGNIERSLLQLLAAETGGLFFEAPTTDELTDIYTTIASVVTNQYELSFINPSPGTAGQFTIGVVDDHLNAGGDSRSIAACP